MSTPQHPEALRLADALERPGYGWHSTPAQCATELRRQHARIAELETQLESIGAGGVSGPLMGCASLAASAVETKQYADGTTATGIAPLPKHSPSVQHALRVLTDVESMLGGANGPTIQIRAVLESLAESAGAQEINGQLYSALGNLFSHLGMEGCIDADHAFVWDAMAALKRIDGGVHLDDLAVPVDPDAHRDDMLAAVRLLEAGEWAEHFAKTPFGMRLEDQITKLLNGVAASAGSEPVAWVDERVISWLANSRSLSATISTTLEKGESSERPMPLYTHPSPPEGMVGGLQVYRCKIKSRKQIDREIPREQQGWWADVAAGQKLLLRQAVQSDLDRCTLGGKRSRNPADYMCETHTGGSLVSKVALEYMNPEENVFAAPPTSSADSSKEQP